MSSAFSANRLYFASKASGTILDCGCGKGLFREFLTALGEVVGLDMNEDFLVKSGYALKVLGSATFLPFRDRAFDFVWACAIVEHIREDCIGEIGRVGNKAVVVTPNRFSPLLLVKELLVRVRLLKDCWELGPGHVRLYSVGELKSYGRVFGDGCGLPLRRVWNKILPEDVWLRHPHLSHVVILEVNNCQSTETRRGLVMCSREVHANIWLRVSEPLSSSSLFC